MQTSNGEKTRTGTCNEETCTYKLTITTDGIIFGGTIIGENVSVIYEDPF